MIMIKIKRIIMIKIMIKIKNTSVDINNFKWFLKIFILKNWSFKSKISIFYSGDIMDGYRQRNFQLDSKSGNNTSYKANDLQIITELLELKKEAYQYNSNIILLYGNHELMNIFNEFYMYLLQLENIKMINLIKFLVQVLLEIHVLIYLNIT